MDARAPAKRMDYFLTCAHESLAFRGSFVEARRKKTERGDWQCVQMFAHAVSASITNCKTNIISYTNDYILV